MSDFNWRDDFTESLNQPAISYYRYEKWSLSRRVKLSVGFGFGVHIREVLVFGGGELFPATDVIYFTLVYFKYLKFSFTLNIHLYICMNERSPVGRSPTISAVLFR